MNAQRNWRYGFALLALVAVAGLSGWLLQTVEAPTTASPGKTRHDPDFYLKDFTLTTMDKTGAPRNRLVSPSMVHYADDNSSEVDQPSMQVFSKNGPPWHIDAGTGWLAAEGKTVILRDGVVIRQTNAEQGRETIIRTPDLTIKPDDEYAETASPVNYSDGTGTVVDAVGMRAHFKEERLELLSQVRGKYVPAEN